MAAATVAPPSSSLPARGRPQNRATQARKPGPRPRRPPRAAGRPDDFADHSSGYPRPSRAAGRFYARQRPLRRHPPLPRASGRKIERCKRESRGRAPAVSDRRRGQRFFAKEARGIVKRDGKGAAAQGETGAAAGRTEWKSGRAPGMEERMMAGPGGGKRRKRKGERARADGAGRRGERARVEGGMQGSRKRSHDEGKAGVRGGGQREGSAGRCGRWMDARGRRTNGEERRPVGRAQKKRTPALQNDPAGVRKNSAPLLYKTTRRACAKIARLCFTKRPGGRAQKKRTPALQNDPAGARKNSAPLLCKRTQRACAKIARHCFAKRPGGRAQK